MELVVTEPGGTDVWDPSLGVSADGCSQCTGGGGEVGEKRTWAMPWWAYGPALLRSQGLGM